MIEFFGFSVKDRNNLDGDIEIEVLGLCLGEKFYEELLIGDNLELILYFCIMKGYEYFFFWIDFWLKLIVLEKMLSDNDV